MTIKLDSNISIISIIGFFIFCTSFFFNVGIWIEINGSDFLEKYDDRKKLMDNARESLFNL
ncbi:MAG: hypothetical protein QM657_03295 [Lacrimispora sp.]|uniref:hypothetical protein n=1 Tax=Lacrimispora sp. TaxID=2719234 RepID=UPI0039E299D4